MADPRSIHEFTTGEVEATTLLLGDFVDLDAQSGYTTLKMSVSDLGEVLLEDIEYTQDLQTTDKTIVGAINENKSVIGYSYDAYDATTAYSTGDLCIYNNVLYKAKQATTGNLPTNTTYWEPTSIADEISTINTGKANSTDFDGCKFKVVPINSNSTFNTPTYTEICTAIIGRGQAGMFVASNNGVVAIFDNQLIRTARVPSGNTQYMSIQNNSSATIIALVIYK